ncbi:MAG: DUF2783 domain-containing protein [Rubrivivax sp.]
MTALITSANFHEPGRLPRQPYEAGDAFYAGLIETHRDLSDEASELLNARLVLLLANHVGDLGVLRQALQVAREGLLEGTVEQTRTGATDTPTPP